MKLLATLACALMLSGCAIPLGGPSQPQAPQSDTARYAASCLRFAAVVDDLTLQRRTGAISDELYLEIDPYLIAGEALCDENAVITDYGDALDDVEGALAAIAEARQ